MISYERNAARFVSKLSNKIRWRLDELSIDKRFSSSQRRVLAYLLVQDPQRDMFQKNIEEEYCIRPASATTLLKHMEANGLITRSAVSYDGRLKKITVTKKGRSYQEQLMKDLAILDADITKGIPQEDLEIFYRVMEKMLDNI